MMEDVDILREIQREMMEDVDILRKIQRDDGGCGYIERNTER